MAKNIIICCDGTGNEFGEQNSNVVKLYRVLKLDDPAQQIAYYHPGVGTMGAKNALTAIGRWWTWFRGLAFGYGISENIADAYQYLMRNFQNGDQVFIFGFSRGAYTARALCGFLEMMGLLSSGNEGQIPYAMRLFKRNDRSFWTRLAFWKVPPDKFRVADSFQKTFCRDRQCKPHFVGVWDTVSSVGRILDPLAHGRGLPYTKKLKDVEVIRHAVSIDERRAFFRTNLVQELTDDGEARDIKQVWFPGVHSDVGGSYPEGESGLSKITLKWMLREAKAAGMVMDDDLAAALLGESAYYARPMPNAMMHNSETIAWWAGEFLPRRGPRGPNLFRRRPIPEGARIHQSAFDRKRLVASYKFRNAPNAYSVEDESAPAIYPVHLEEGEQFVAGIHAQVKWNDTGLQLRRGERYRFVASGTWNDASIRCGPEGYPSRSLFFRLLQWRRRFPRGQWFELIGALDRDEKSAFAIGAGTEMEMDRDGVLYCYANDLRGFYGNNSRVVTLSIVRLAAQELQAAAASGA